MERRRSSRSKRRIPCEFQHQGHRYRGIAVNASPSGLFIQTNATLDPGVELEIVFLGDRLPGVSLRGTVARRRAPPAALDSVIRAGLGLRIAEAPDAYLEFLGMGLLPREAPLEAKQRREHPAEALATPLREAAASALETLLAAWVTAPPALSRAVEWTSPDAKEPAPGAATDDRIEATRRVRRRWRRTSFDPKVIALHGHLKRARQVLFARDLSIGGARVDPHPDLQVGDRLKLALYDHASPDSIVVDAQVLRNEGERGLALRFLNSPTRTAQKIGHLLERAGEIERCDAAGDAHPVIVAEVVQEEGA